MDCITLDEFEQLKAELLTEGYSSYYQAEDAEAVEDYPCPMCDKSGVVYYSGYWLDLEGSDIYGMGYSYRAFAQCAACGRVWEF